jgi:hypothetical protein
MSFRHKAFIFSLIPFLILVTTSRGQVSGTLTDSATGKPIDKFVVTLIIRGSEPDTSFHFTDEKGVFTINPVPSTPFSLLFNQMGFRPIARFFPNGDKSKKIDAGKIVLAPAPKMLEEVFVQAPAIVIKEDTIEYRADAFKVKENAMTEDLLKKLPGIQVDKDGNVTAQGKSVTRVKVNGKDFFGGDVKTATRELPANLIDKVQVVDDYGDQATVSGIRDGDPEKIINLQIKKDKNKGVFGRATAGIGTDDRYQASINANYFNNERQISLFGNSNNTSQSLFNFGGGGNGSNAGMSNMMRNGQRMMNDMGGGANSVMSAFKNGDQGFINTGNGNNGISTTHSIGTNYRDQWGKKITVYGSYSFSNRNNDLLQTTATQNFFENGSFTNNQQTNSNTVTNNHRFFFNMEYQIDSFNYLKLSPSVSFASNNSANATAFTYFGRNEVKTSEGYNSESKTPSYSATILYNHRFRKKGRNFSTNLTLGSARNNSDQFTRNNTNNFTSNPPLSFSLYQSIAQVNPSRNYGIRLTYSEPISKTRNIDIALSRNLNYTRNDRKTYNNDPALPAPLFVPGLSNDFENSFYNNRAGISLRTTMKKYNYTLGISVQPVSLRGKSITNDSSFATINRLTVFPIARFAYNFSKTKTFNASYSGNATQPTYTQLQNVPDLSNPQSITLGNPGLQPAINHNVNLSYNNFNFSSGRVIFTSLTLSAIRNQIVNNVISNGNAGAQLSIPENVNGYYNINSFYLFSKPYKNRKYVLTLNGSLNFNHNINLVDSIRSIGLNWIGSQGFMFEFNYKTWLEFGAGATYSFNDVTYKQTDRTKFSPLQNTSSSALTITSSIDIDLKEKWILKYNFDYTINYGLNAAVSRNLAILNASIERQVFKKKNGVIKFSALDLLNQNTNINRTVSANAITDTRTNRLARYFLLSFTYRLQKFRGQKPQNPGFRGMMPSENKNAEIKVF